MRLEACGEHPCRDLVLQSVKSHTNRAPVQPVLIVELDSLSIAQDTQLSVVDDEARGRHENVPWLDRVGMEANREVSERKVPHRVLEVVMLTYRRVAR